jgi:V8-like Glu-specific endopeptidase
MSGLSHVRRLVAARTQAAAKAVAPEAMTIELANETDPPRADDVLQRVDEVMQKLPPEEGAESQEFQRALTIFMSQADRTLRRMDKNPEARLDANEQLVLEAVIRTDGTRPTLLVRNNTINPDHPLAGGWRDTLFAIRDTVRARAAAIGRIEPANGSPTRFFGTGWLVDANGIVLTNLHVLHAMLNAIPNAMIQSGSKFRVLKGGAFIDFAGEDGSLVKKRFRVVEATPSGIDGPVFARLDAAVLRIEPLDVDGGAAAMPAPIPVVADLGGPTGAMSSFCVIGFPGRPEVMSGVVDGVDWDWVTQTLFGNRFGLKRLAPGVAHKPLGQVPDDARPWVFGHDATTLGGSSGSPVLAWRDAGFGGFGLHFAGATVDKNCAHAIAQCRQELEKIGVPVSDPD